MFPFFFLAFHPTYISKLQSPPSPQSPNHLITIIQVGPTLTKIPSPKPSNPLHLVRLDDRIRPGDGVAAGAFEVEAAPVLLRVPVGTAKRSPAPAREPHQPHALPAATAPVLHNNSLLFRGNNPFPHIIIQTNSPRFWRWRWWRDMNLVRWWDH